MTSRNRLIMNGVKLWLIFCLIFTGLLIGQPKANAESFYYRIYPKGGVGILRPVIGITFTELNFTPRGSFNNSTFSLDIDNNYVSGNYDETSKSYNYIPTKDMTVGKHTVNLTINFPGYEPINQKWEFSISEFALSEPPAEPTTEQQQGINAINDYRALHGLKPLKFNKHLSLAAKMHAQYLSANKVDPKKISMHEETSTLPGFIGKSSSDRGLYAGYTGAIAEDVSYLTGNLTESIDGLYDAPYHRTPFMDPDAFEIGVHQQGDYTVLEFGLTMEWNSQLVVSPAPGDNYVPIDFDGHETPDPIRNFKDIKYPVGYPIMVLISGRVVKDLNFEEAKITDSAGREVQFLLNSSKNDDHLQNEIMLIPTKPLTPDTSYSAYVKLSGTENGSAKVYEKRWDFRTEPANSVGKKKLHTDSAAYIKQMNLATKPQHIVTFGLSDDKFILDNVPVPMLRKPIIEDGSSYLWVRDLAGALGATVTWDDQLKAAIYAKQGRTITLFTTKKAYALNGVETPTDSPAILSNSSTFIPVRLLSEVLGAKVEYEDSTRTVKISY